MQNLCRVGKNTGPILATCGSKFLKFWKNLGPTGDPLYFAMLFSIVYIMFHSEDIPNVGKNVQKGSFGSPNFRGADPKFWMCVCCLQIWLTSQHVA